MILITGVPRSGKSTLARMINPSNCLSTDSLIGHADWSKISDIVAKAIQDQEYKVIEGTAVVRAIRKLISTGFSFNKHPVVFLDQPKLQLTKEQETMAKGIITIWNEIKSFLPFVLVEPKVDPKIAKRRILV